MLSVLFLLPVLTTATLGAVYLLTGSQRARWGPLVVVLFAVAAYLQFGSRHVLAGLLLQVAVALALAIWHRVSRL